MRIKTNKSGQSILEVIIAMAIFALVSVTLVTLAAGSFVGLEQGGEQTEAENLAQEGIEAVKSIYENAWNELKYNTSSVSVSENKWIFDGEGTVETIGQFTRTISFSPVCRNASDDIVNCPGSYADPHSKKVSVTVTWDTQKGKSNTVKRESHITNWDSEYFVQTDWSGGSGQSQFGSLLSYNLNDGNINVDVIGQATLNTVALGGFESSGYIISSAFDTGKNSSVQIIEWDEVIPACSPACSVELKVSTAPDSGGVPGIWTNWYGAGGVLTTFTESNGTLISTDLNGNRWFRYKLNLTGDGISTPTVSELRINYR